MYLSMLQSKIIYIFFYFFLTHHNIFFIFSFSCKNKKKKRFQKSGNLKIEKWNHLKPSKMKEIQDFSDPLRCHFLLTKATSWNNFNRRTLCLITGTNMLNPYREKIKYDNTSQFLYSWSMLCSKVNIGIYCVKMAFAYSKLPRWNTNILWIIYLQRIISDHRVRICELIV